MITNIIVKNNQFVVYINIEGNLETEVFNIETTVEEIKSWMLSRKEHYYNLNLQKEEILNQINNSDNHIIRVHMYQLLTVLSNKGILSQVEAIIEQAPLEVQFAWNRADMVRRDSPTVNQLLQVLGLSQEEGNEIFKTASELKL